MSSSALAVTYHGVDRAAGPLSVTPELLREHLDRIVDAGVPVLTISEIAAHLHAGTLPHRAVALTFDDAFGSVPELAAPLLAERRLRATVFVVAGAVGGTNAWPTQPPGVAEARLAGAAELRGLAAAGWEVGSHGTRHAPLARISDAEARSEIVDSKAALEHSLQLEVSSFALPYGVPPGARARELLDRTYDAVCTTRPGMVGPGTSRQALPRVDAHYLRRPGMLGAALDGSATAYLQLRGVAARARRVVRKDYVAAAS
ncbi:MAG TPA: polysaccharide deacetylase family protein [Thermoleophilaceae bacterium]|nr:polysaccharide deacetylase family protein [Thermoleophilaceae bacterium]